MKKRKELQTRFCVICNSIFFKDNKAITCSDECKHKLIGLKRLRPTKSNCEYCKKIFIKNNKNRNNKTCSKECHKKLMSIIMSGKPYTEEHRINCSIAQKKYFKEHPERRVIISNRMRGFKHTEDQNKAKSLRMQGHKLSKETINKILQKRKGFKHTEETKKRLSIIIKKRYENLEYRKKMCGRKREHSIQERLIISEKMRGRDNSSWIEKTCSKTRGRPNLKLRGEKHPNWRGGLNKQKYKLWEFNKAFKNSIKERDNYTCQICHKQQEKYFAIHHIDYIKDNNFTYNCITLCINCHIKTNINRNLWTTWFQTYMAQKYGYSYPVQTIKQEGEIKQ